MRAKLEVTKSRVAEPRRLRDFGLNHSSLLFLLSRSLQPQPTLSMVWLSAISLPLSLSLSYRW
jgi:hypothetical protein